MRGASWRRISSAGRTIRKVSTTSLLRPDSRTAGRQNRRPRDVHACGRGRSRHRADFAKRLRILQVHRCRWAQEGPRLHEILEIPSNLELESLIDMDVLLGRNLTHDQRYSSDHVAPQIAGRERGRIAEVSNV